MKNVDIQHPNALGKHALFRVIVRVTLLHYGLAG